MALEKETIKRALAKVQDPILQIPLVDLGYVTDIRVGAGDRVHLHVELTKASWPLREKVKGEVEEALRGIGVVQPEIHLIEKAAQAGGKAQTVAQKVKSGEEPLLTMIKHVILVASGKGGVGKSTVAVNLAVALAHLGARTALLDADIYGPSVPIMLGLEGEQPSMVKDGEEQKIVPMQAFGLEAISMGMFVPADVAMAWRGPMVHGALLQFMRDVMWSPADYMIMDLPPGTGDIHMTLAQKIQPAGAVIVTTPQIVALADVIRAKAFFDKLRVPQLGVVENMSYFVGDDGKEYDIFGRGGGQKAAERFELPLLGSIPLVPSIRQGSDDGKPEVARNPESPASQAFLQIAKSLMEKLPT